MPEMSFSFTQGWSVESDQEFNSGLGWSREDIWSQAHGNLDDYPGVATDVHAIRPADITVNRARGDRDFDEGGTLYLDGNGDTGAFRDEDSWEPRDEVKGDIARMLFYMAVRYEGGENEPDLELLDTVWTQTLPSLVWAITESLQPSLNGMKLILSGVLSASVTKASLSSKGIEIPSLTTPEYVYRVWDTSQAIIFIPDTTVVEDTTEVLTANQHDIESPMFLLYPNPAKISYFLQQDRAV